MYAARRTGLKKEMFGYVPGGYARIFERFAEVLRGLGVEFSTSHALKSVRRDRQSERVQLEFHNGYRPQFDNVVLTIPATAISHVCPDLREDEKQRFDGVEYLGVVCASVLLKKPLAGYYVTNITDTWVPLTGIIEMSAIVDRRELGGHSLIYLPKYVPSADPMFERPDADIREEFLGTLEKMYSHFSRGDVLEFKVGRARNVMALPTLNYSKNLPPVVTSIPGVYAINSALIVKGNLNVNETIQAADEALEVAAESLNDRPSADCELDSRLKTVG
jgi:protoporphyrinogen oxidase